MGERGKFIAIEGSDSSGKELQSGKLKTALENLNYPVRFLDFPRYDEFFGKVVGRYLRGELGGLSETHPVLAVFPYAMDRYEMKDKISEWLDNGEVIVSNRYVGSNLGHMSAKLPEDEREDFIKWAEELEYVKLGIPKEDLAIFLHVPARIGQKLTMKKDKKIYMKGLGRGDLHEKNLEYLQNVVRQFLWLSENRDHWEKIDCMLNEEELRSADEIHREVLDVIEGRNILITPSIGSK